MNYNLKHTTIEGWRIEDILGATEASAAKSNAYFRSWYYDLLNEYVCNKGGLN